MSRELVIPEEARVRYLERRKMDVEALRADLDAMTFEEFKRIGHQLRGNALSFGYPELEKVAVKMEEAGNQRDVRAATEQLAIFAAWLKAKTRE